MEVRYKRLNTYGKMPRKAHPGDAAYDLFASEVNTITHPDYGVYYEVKTGIALEIPEGYCGLLYPRSSVYKMRQYVANSVGVIDSNYRGEIKAIFRPDGGQINHAQPEFKRGDRVAQLMIVPALDVEFIHADELTDSDRGEGGYGSTGR